jgi:hypothetical protein
VPNIFSTHHLIALLQLNCRHLYHFDFCASPISLIFINDFFVMVFAKNAKTQAKDIHTIAASTDSEQVLVRGYRN